MIILPLQKNRRTQDEFMENTLQLVRHFGKAAPLDKSKRLATYVNRETGYLNMAKYRVMVTTLMRNEPFFKRYDL
jgi:hypothetical protein